MINEFLAKLLERFKSQQPKTWAGIAVVLAGLYAVLSDPTLVQIMTDSFGLPGWFAEVTKAVAFALALFTGSHTSHMKNTQK